MSTVKIFSIWFRIRKIFQALITIRWHEQTVNTEFIEDFLYGSKIIKMFQTLIGILTMNILLTLRRFIIGLHIQNLLLFRS